MDYLQDVHIAGRDYSAMAIAIIILSGIHVILSLVFSVMAYRKGLRKEGGAWLLSFGVCVAILVLAAVATGQKDNFTAHTPPHSHLRTRAPADNLEPSKCKDSTGTGTFQCNNGCKKLGKCNCCQNDGGEATSCYDGDDNDCNYNCLTYQAANPSLPDPPPCSPV